MYPVGIDLRDPRSQRRYPTARRGTLGFHLSALQGGTGFVISLPTCLSESAARCVVHGPGLQHCLLWFAQVTIRNAHSRRTSSRLFCLPDTEAFAIIAD